jgi:hypothetical protein
MLTIEVLAEWGIAKSICTAAVWTGQWNKITGYRVNVPSCDRTFLTAISSNCGGFGCNFRGTAWHD